MSIYTKKAIMDSFVKMLSQKSFDKITIKDIIEDCGLNRSTFYANYVDLYDLADKVRVHLESEVNHLYETERTQKFNSNDYLRLFRHIQENQLFYRTYFKLGYDNQYEIQFYDTEQAKQDFNNQYIDYHMEFFKSGLTAIIKRWLAGGCRETPEEMDHIVRSEYQGRGR